MADTFFDKVRGKVLTAVKAVPLRMGLIEFFGEFGGDLISVAPYAYWLHVNQRLRRTRGVRDTQPLYYFSPRHEEIDQPRKLVTPVGFPVSYVHKPQINTSQWIPPPYKTVYQNSRFRWDKPLCVISNKYTYEWGRPPVNFLSLKALQELFGVLQKKYQVIYNRPTPKQIVADEHEILNLGDHAMIRRMFPGVLMMSELWEKNKDLSFNTLQMMVFSNCDHFISVQGGNSVLASYFGGTNIIYAVEGRELEVNSFENWYHLFSGCQIHVAQDEADLIRDVQKTYI